MSLHVDRFEDFFGALYKKDNGDPLSPFPWQSRLAKLVYDEGWPDCIDLPTASGKTTAIDIAVFVLACQAGRPTNGRTVGRRLYFTVNRRVIVDEAFDRSKKLAQALLDANAGILKEVADALRSTNETGDDSQTPPLDVRQLRGGIYRDGAWARSLTQPMVVCTTADQLGSRLLFRGYGVSDTMKPIHAALCACDSLVLLDEAHVTKAFSQTMQLLTKYQELRSDKYPIIPQMRFVQMTATPAGQVTNRFALDDADWANEVLRNRQTASKPATLVKLGKKKSVVDEIVTRSTGAVSDTRKAIGIIVNRVQTAREIHAKLIDKFPQEEVHLIIGRMRPIDRDTLQSIIIALVGPGRDREKRPLEKPVFVIATQCLEVGADYDFDVLITECASIDAIRQRFGRLNRKGREIDVVAAIVTNDEPIDGDDPIYGSAIKHTWEWLSSKQDEQKQVDFGIASFKRLWQEVERERAMYLDPNCPKPLLSPAPDAAVLLPAHLDALCQTAPQPAPSPDVSYFIHGPQRDNAEVSVCWRADLGDNDSIWPEIVRLLPPSSAECMTVPLAALRNYLGQRYKSLPDADVPTTVLLEVEDDKHASRIQATSLRVTAWRGKNDVRVVSSPGEIRPNDTVIIRTEDFGWESLGHIPGAPTIESLEELVKRTDEPGVVARKEIERRRDAVDVAERVTRQSRLRIVLRLHPMIAGRAELLGLDTSELRNAIRRQFAAEPIDEAERSRVIAIVSTRFDQHFYSDADQDQDDEKRQRVIVFKRRLDPPNPLVLPTIDEDDEEDNLSQQDRFVLLDCHTQHVVDRLAVSVKRLHIDRISQTFGMSAELHDIGKADARFQAMLRGLTPHEVIALPLLAKGDGQRRTCAEMGEIFRRAIYPGGFRHEMLSVELIENPKMALDGLDRELLLHLIASHHGHARPFAPVVIDMADDETRSIEVNDIFVTAEQRKSWTLSHRLDSGIAERFWRLTRDHGWWGLAWLESTLRLADQQASAAEQKGDVK